LVDRPLAGTNKKVETLRTALIAIERAMGKPIGEIAQKYELSRGVVTKELSLAEESGILDAFKRLAYDRLVSPALAVYDAQLALGNLEAARDVAFGLGIFQKTPDASKFKGKAMDTLDAYRSARKTTGEGLRPTRPAAEVTHVDDVH
jgi:hypothetical protein